MRFFFMPDFSKIDGQVLISAMGQSFFSLSIGMGALITYGSYIGAKDNMVSSSVSVVFADTLVAVLAGIIIFPAAFSFGIKPEAGPSLVFTTLPMVFQQMTGGYFFCLIFFVLLVIATLTSTISLLEVIVATATEELKLSRPKAAVLGSLVTAVIGVLATLSFRTGSPLHINGKIFFDVLDSTTALYLMPIGGLLIVLYAGWRMKKGDVLDELTNGGALRGGIGKVIYYLIRYMAPVAIAVIFISQLIGE